MRIKQQCILFTTVLLLSIPFTATFAQEASVTNNQINDSEAHDPSEQIQNLFKEVFGVEIEDTTATKPFNIYINGQRSGLDQITYRTVSQTVEFSSAQLKKFILPKIKPEKKDEIQQFLNRHETINSSLLTSIKIDTQLNETKQKITLNIPPNLMKENIISLSFSDQNLNPVDKEAYQKSAPFSNYTNLYYTKRIEHDTHNISDSITYRGAFSLFDFAFPYYGSLDSQTFFYTLYKSLPSIGTTIEAGKIGDSNVSGLQKFKELNSTIYGIVIDENHKASEKQKKNNQFEFEITEKSTVTIYHNLLPIYKHTHYPGKYIIKNLKLVSGKNRYLISIENSSLKLIKKTIYYQESLAPFRMHNSFTMGLPTEFIEEGTSYTFSDLQYSAVNRIGLANNLELQTTSVYQSSTIFQSYDIKTTNLFGSYSLGLKKSFDPKQISSLVYTLNYTPIVPDPLMFFGIRSININQIYNSRIETENGVENPAVTHKTTFTGGLRNSIDYSFSHNFSIEDGERENTLDYSGQILLQGLYTVSHKGSLDLSSKSYTFTSSSEIPIFRVFTLTGELTNTISEAENDWSIAFSVNLGDQIGNNRLDAKIESSYDNTDGLGDQEYSLTHEYETSTLDHDFSATTYSDFTNHSSSVLYSDDHQSIDYSLSLSDEEKTQQLQYSNSFANFTISEDADATQIQTYSAIAFTHKQMGISQAIGDGFILMKPHKTVKDTYIKTGSSRSWKVFSATQSDSQENVYETFSYDSKVKEGNPYEVPSSEEFKLFKKKYMGYNVTALDNNIFHLKTTIFFEDTKEPIPVGTFVRLISKESKDILPLLGFVNKPGEIAFDNIPIGNYALSIEGYRAIPIDAKNIEQNTTLELNSVYLKTTKQEIKLYK